MIKSPPQSDAALVGSFLLWAIEIESHTGVTICGQAHRDAICAAARELLAIRKGRSKGGRQLTDAKRQQLRDAASKPRPKRKKPAE